MKSFIQNFCKISYKNYCSFKVCYQHYFPILCFLILPCKGQTVLNNGLLNFITVLQTLFSGNTKLLRAFSPKISESEVSFLFFFLIATLFIYLFIYLYIARFDMIIFFEDVYVYIHEGYCSVACFFGTVFV